MASILEPVTLSSWPTCKDCLAWSEDNLAVASGEVIHILTPRSALPDTKSLIGYWFIETLRINQFNEQEWPSQNLAPLQDFSIGEEQSNSLVVSLAWSPPGLGIHRRNVLAVLTSNLILSLWESNGLSNTWRRTLILNHHLAAQKSPYPSRNSRRKIRVRAFIWLPVIPRGKHDIKQNWGKQYLSVADDDNSLLVFEVSKNDSTLFGGWNVHCLAFHQTPRDFADIHSNDQPYQSLQSILQNGPVTQLVATDCVESHQIDDENQVLHSVGLSAYKGPPMLSQTVQEYKLELKTPADAVGTDIVKARLVLIDSRLTTRIVTDDRVQETRLQTAMSKPLADFNRQYNLKGKITTRIWGATSSADGNYIAACFTLHPSDTIEYTIPSVERCTIVFAFSGMEMSIDSTHLEDKVVHGKILNFIVEHADEHNTKSDLDNRLLSVAANCIRAAFPKDFRLENWARKQQAEMVANASADNIPLSHEDPPSNGQVQSSSFIPRTEKIEEHCEICHSPMIVESDLAQTRCLKGHRFIRCGISFLAIQEPGISKYCSQCGKQFLSWSKLKNSKGPSLIRAVFEEFDICPYCRGKFRG